MPQFESRVDVDPDEFVSECSIRERKQLIEILIKTKSISKSDYDVINPSLEDKIWFKICQKLYGGRLQLSNQDEETITKIANKL